MTLGGHLSSEVQGGLTINSNCEANGATMTFAHDAAFVALPFGAGPGPIGFASGTVTSSGSVTSGPLTGTIESTRGGPRGAITDFNMGPIEFSSAAGTANVHYTPSSGVVQCANYANTDLSGLYTASYLNALVGCTRVDGWDRFIYSAGTYEALITSALAGGGSVVERGRYEHALQHQLLDCTRLGGSRWLVTNMDVFYYPESREERDSVGPLVTGTPSRPPNANGWYRAPLTIDWYSADPAPSSGTPSDPSDTEASTQGANVSYQSDPSCDPAGNCSTGLLSLSLDSVPPTISGSASPVANSLGWNNTPVVLTFACNDEMSGIATCSSPVTIDETSGTNTIGTSTDRAGNTAGVSVGPVKVDITAPMVDLLGNAGTYRADQALSVSCRATDNLSGIATQNCPVLPAVAGALSLGFHSYQVSAFDNAGNFTTKALSFTVTRGLALTTDQCKNGGWANLVDDLGRGFSNQGDCVSFVATGGRNKAKG